MSHRAGDSGLDTMSVAMTRHALERVMAYLLWTSDWVRQARESSVVVDDELWKRAQADDSHSDAYKHSRVLRNGLKSLLALTVRVGDESVGLNSLSPATHRFKGVWRPPTRPQTPEELECSAVICTCLMWLRDAEQVEQHWASGCFDLPEFERRPDA